MRRESNLIFGGIVMVRGWIGSWLLLAVLSLSGAAMAGSETVLKDFAGAPSGIEQYSGKGKWLVVVIWASDCHVCDMEMPEYADFHKRHEKKDAQVLGVSMDGADKQADAEAFIARHKLPFPNLIGEPQALALYYMMQTGGSFAGTPTILVYNPEGVLRAAQAGAVPPAVIEDFMAKETLAAAGK